MDLSLVPEAVHFNELAIAKYIGGKQSARKGQRAVAAAEVTNLKRAVDFSYSASVHSEKTGQVAYLVQVRFTGNQISASSCPCLGRHHPSHKCKHVAALLFALLALKQYAPPHGAPVWAHRPGMSRFTGSSLAAEIRADLTWSDVLDELVQPTQADASGKRPKLTTEPVKKKAKGRKKTRYCYCKEEYDEDADRPMVECPVCKDWFHFDCVKRITGEEVPLPAIEWECAACRRVPKKKKKPVKKDKKQQ
mgnify:FL=1